jgi:hypothetical protein
MRFLNNAKRYGTTQRVFKDFYKGPGFYFSQLYDLARLRKNLVLLSYSILSGITFGWVKRGFAYTCGKNT